jgi:LacI family transcriptional regulator
VNEPRVLVVLGTDAAWSRGVLRGFMAAAHSRGWALLHYHPASNLDWLAEEWSPTAAVIGPELDPQAVRKLAPASIVSVTVDRAAHQIPSVCLDEAAIASLALEHLLSTGLRHVTTFRFDESPFAVSRERAFVERARAAGVRVSAGWGSGEQVPPQRGEHPAAMTAWLRELAKPCGIFTCTDSWGRAVARYARAAGVRIPEDVALVGVDNDVLECELISPPLSSVLVPWQELGRSAAELLQLALSNRLNGAERRVISPTTVVARRSSDALSIADPVVEKAVRWIRDNDSRRLTVTMVARALGGGRQRLERRFRSVLDRTVQEEIRRAHVQAAKRLLETTRQSLREIAKQSGFTTPALLNVAFQREVGVSPGVYRRRVQKELAQNNTRE